MRTYMSSRYITSNWMTGDKYANENANSDISGNRYSDKYSKSKTPMVLSQVVLLEMIIALER